MSWIFWVIVFAWVVPVIMRKMGQPPRDRRQIPPRDRGYNRYGGYPGNPYPGGYPGSQPRPQDRSGSGQPVPPQSAPGGNPPGGNPQGGNPPGGNPRGINPAGTGWWQQPIPPGTFPGQQPPRTSSGQQWSGQPSHGGPQQAPTQQRTAQQAPPQGWSPSAPQGVPPTPHADEPQGYRAKKLAELDQQFTDQKISLEEYMKARNEVMRG